TGLHPSYAAHSRPGRLQQERDLLRNYTDKEVVHSRQHYLKFRLPDTYRQLIAAGIKEEYSMGYATQNGFRAGTSRSFLWFDLLQNEVSGLRVHPFVFMDATAWFYQQYNLTEAFSEWERLYLAVGKNGGTFISIWHN